MGGQLTYRADGATVASVHRAMNDRRQKLESSVSGVTKCECECERVECSTNFALTVERYDDVRTHAGFFVVAPGHECFGERIVSNTATYLVIEKPRGRPASA
jgi:hypothetical protein